MPELVRSKLWFNHNIKQLANQADCFQSPNICVYFSVIKEHGKKRIQNERYFRVLGRYDCACLLF